MRKHTWYLDETLNPLALVDPDVDPKEEEARGKKLASIPVPEEFHHTGMYYSQFYYTNFNQISLRTL